MKPYDKDHPEQDPAEGSREVIDKDLAEQGGPKGGASGQGEAPGAAESDRGRDQK